MDTLQTVMIASFVGWIGLLALIVYVAGCNVRAPVFVFLGSWLAIGTFLLSGLVIYDRVFTGASLVSLVAATGCFAFGTVLAQRVFVTRRADGQPVDVEIARGNVWLEALLLLTTAAYVTLIARDALAFLASGGLTADALLELRAEHTEKMLDSTVTIESIARAIMRVGATLVAAGTALYVRRRKPVFACAGLLTIGALAAESLLAGGRVVIAYITIAAVAAYVLNKAQSKGRFAVLMSRIKWALLASVLAAMGYLMFVVFPALRNPDLGNDVSYFLGYLHDAQLADWVVEAGSQPGMEWLPVFAFASCYVSQPIVKYTFFLAESDIEGWYRMGALSFPLVSKVATALTGRANPWAAIRADLDDVSVRFGYAGNPWSTGMRDFVVDFGQLGACVAMILLGVALQIVYLKARASPAQEWKVAVAVAYPIAFFFAFFNPLPLGLFMNTLLVAVVLALLTNRGRVAATGRALVAPSRA